MNGRIKIKSALLSVFAKEGILPLAKILEEQQVEIISTGGTYQFLRDHGIRATPIESITSYPSILGGRVKTLHPKIFGGILWRRNEMGDAGDVARYEIPSVDMVVVDLYPFEETVAKTSDEAEIIEKIDIGGVSLIRAAAKNFKHVLVVPSASFFEEITRMLKEDSGYLGEECRKRFAAHAFSITSHYDTQIYRYFNRELQLPGLRVSCNRQTPLRYGENPHQKGTFYGELDQVLEQLSGKELSYNNLVDCDAALHLIDEFTNEDPTVVIIKHTNPCGIASRTTLPEAWKDALACDPVSAFGGIITMNRPLDMETAREIHTLFFEILIVTEIENDALNLLTTRKNRIILRRKTTPLPANQFRSLLNGVLEQDKDLKTETKQDLTCVTGKQPDARELNDLLYANKVVKHLKSNTIVLVKNQQMIGCGMGQTSRVDALRQAISKARAFGFDTSGSVLASDAFFPFADSVEIAFQEGIRAVIQPGGSIRDSDSIAFCQAHDMAMVFTGTRHFKH